MDSEFYFIRPIPDGDYLIALSRKLSKDGYELVSVQKDIFLLQNIRQVLLEKGATAILSQQLLNEEVLPDNTPRNFIIDTLRYKLDRCSPTQSLLIIDPYLYPAKEDSDYQTDFLTVFGDSLKKCFQLDVATLPSRNSVLEFQIDSAIEQINPNIAIYKKYTDVFHDRFWIADQRRGVFVGTSLNGIGKRYALIDYLREDDATAIVQRYAQIS